MRVVFVAQQMWIADLYKPGAWPLVNGRTGRAIIGGRRYRRVIHGTIIPQPDGWRVNLNSDANQVDKQGGQRGAQSQQLTHHLRGRLCVGGAARREQRDIGQNQANTPEHQ